MNKILISAAVFIFLLSGAVLAVPGIPHQFYGNVAYNGESAPDGLSVVAKIDGVLAASTVTYDGAYSLIVADYNNTRSGAFVSFFVDGIDTTKMWIFCNGCFAEVSLSVTHSPVTTPPSSPPGGGGSSTGGNVVSTGNVPGVDGEDESDAETVKGEVVSEATDKECVERWVCSEWGGCVDSIHKRICTDENNCGTEDYRPFETEPCPILKEETNEAGAEAGEEPAGILTGFALAETLQKPKNLAVGIILIVLLLGIYVTFSRNKRNSNKANKAPNKANKVSNRANKAS